jgi:hypothetical protein
MPRDCAVDLGLGCDFFREDKDDVTALVRSVLTDPAGMPARGGMVRAGTPQHHPRRPPGLAIITVCSRSACSTLSVPPGTRQRAATGSEGSTGVVLRTAAE